MTRFFSFEMHSARKKEELEVIKLCRATTTNMSIMDFEGLGTDLGDDESDKEYDIPIDPVWEAQQMRTFTAWCNAHLRKANMKIEVFEQDFRSGLKLMKLLEIISNDSLPAPDRGKMRFHKIANVNKALKFIEDKGVKLASVGAEEIVDGNIKMTLGMIWTIILRFTIQDILIEDSSAKDGLLLWCKQKTSGYKNLDVSNFKSSFQNGLAFCALIHNHDPALIDYDSLSPKNARHNLDLAFSVADKNLDVPQMLSAEDMVISDHSDERSIMAYVSSYYHTFSGREKTDEAIRTINEIITDKMKEDSCNLDCEKTADGLLQWIDAKTTEFQIREEVEEQCEIASKIEEFNRYKCKEKPTQTLRQVRLQSESVHACDSTKNKCEDIASRWLLMEVAEEGYEDYLKGQRDRAEGVARLLAQVNRDCRGLEDCRLGQGGQLEPSVHEGAGLNELRLLARKEGVLEAEVTALQPRAEKMLALVDQLRGLRYKDVDAVDAKVRAVLTAWDSFITITQERVKSIDAHLLCLTRVDELQLEFAKKASPLYLWLLDSNECLDEKYEIHNIDRIKEMIVAQESLKATVVDLANDVEALKSIIMEIDTELASVGRKAVPINPYTTISMQNVHDSWQNLEGALAARDSYLSQSLAAADLEDKRLAADDRTDSDGHALDMVPTLTFEMDNAKSDARVKEADDARATRLLAAFKVLSGNQVTSSVAIGALTRMQTSVISQDVMRQTLEVPVAEFCVERMRGPPAACDYGGFVETLFPSAADARQ